MTNKIKIISNGNQTGYAAGDTIAAYTNNEYGAMWAIQRADMFTPPLKIIKPDGTEINIKSFIADITQQIQEAYFGGY